MTGPEATHATLLSLIHLYLYGGSFASVMLAFQGHHAGASGGQTQLPPHGVATINAQASLPPHRARDADVQLSKRPFLDTTPTTPTPVHTLKTQDPFSDHIHVDLALALPATASVGTKKTSVTDSVLTPTAPQPFDIPLYAKEEIDICSADKQDTATDTMY